MERYLPHKPVAGMQVIVMDIKTICPACKNAVYFPKVVGFYRPFNRHTPNLRVFQFQSIPDEPGIIVCTCFLDALSICPRIALYADNSTFN